ncbi:hypothetical protein V7968_32705 [Nocardia vulneris]|uniref:hypothetical protein n=1 Tax=Nocardia vulneris TaxID=1141657 RepID=UPI0030D46DD0
MGLRRLARRGFRQAQFVAEVRSEFVGLVCGEILQADDFGQDEALRVVTARFGGQQGDA